MLIKDIILLHYKKYPEMEEVDFIKLLYQNAFGVNHLINSKGLEYLKKEYNLFEHNIQINEYVDIGNDMIRLSLDKTNLKPETIYNLLATKSENEEVSHKQFLANVDCLTSLIKEESLNLDIFKIDSLLEQNNFYKFIAPSHSEKYHNFYDPHYRVLKKSEFLDVLSKEIL